MFDKSIYHTTPEEALNVAQDLKSKKVIGMHWGTFVLSLEPIMEPRQRVIWAGTSLLNCKSSS